MWKVLPTALALVLTTTGMRAQHTPDPAAVDNGRDLFAAWREGLPEDAIKARIEALVRYLETIQERASH
jgi:hypothetical protein